VQPSEVYTISRRRELSCRVVALCFQQCHDSSQPAGDDDGDGRSGMRLSPFELSAAAAIRRS